jgi:hypothetical protein
MEPPVSQMAAAFKPTFRRLDGTIGASGATDHDALLEAPELMPVRAEQVFEKAHSISAHGLGFLGLPRTEGFDLAQYSTYFGSLMPPRRFPPPWTVEDIGGSFVVKAKQQPAAGLHLLLERHRPSIPREVIDLQRGTTRIAVNIAKLPELVRRALGGGLPGDQGCVLLLIYINVCAFQIGHFTRTAERIFCHDALSFRASTFGRGSFLFMTAKLSELLRSER